MPLTIARIKAAAPKDRDYKLFDENGLFLLVTPAGGRHWKLRYRLKGKEQRLALGSYPDMSLSDARAAAREKLDILAAGGNPAKKQVSQTETFQHVYEQWMVNRDLRLDAKTCAATRARMEMHALPVLGHQGINDLEPADILEVIRAIEARGTFEVSYAVYKYVNGVFLYGVATGAARRNPAADIAAAIIPPRRDKHFPHLSEKELPDFLRAIERYHGELVYRAAAKLLNLTFVRTNEMRWARWDEFDLDDALWRIPKERMKGVKKFPHIVPLSHQSVALLREEIHPVTGNMPFVFSNPKKPAQPISENAVLQLYYNIGYKGKMTGHGIRHVVSTILNESGKFRPDAIERQMAHVPKGVRATYNHAQYLDERRELMQWWADQLDRLRAASKRS